MILHVWNTVKRIPQIYPKSTEKGAVSKYKMVVEGHFLHLVGGETEALTICVLPGGYHEMALWLAL